MDAFEIEDRRVQREKQKAKERVKFLIDLKSVMGTLEGQNVLRNLFASTGVFQLSYNAINASDTNFREGQRSVGLHLLRDMTEADHDTCREIMSWVNKKGD